MAEAAIEMDQKVAFRVGLTDDGVYDNIMATESARLMLESTPGVEIAPFPVDAGPVDPKILDEFDVVLAGGRRVIRESVAGVERCSAIVRFGAGFDTVDLDVCTDAGIIVATTPGSVRRSMATAGQYDIERVDLPALLSQSDFVVVLCPLGEETRHLVGAEELRLMKPSAYLVNVARGAIVDQQALVRALFTEQIRGAGLDALDPEPIDPDDPLLALDNVNLTPHAIGITDEMIRLGSELSAESALDVRRGEAPVSVVNRAVLDSSKLKAKLDAYRQRYGSATR